MHNHFSNYLSKPSTLGSFAFQPVTPFEVELEILSMPHNKAYRFFSCPTRMLKCASKTISKPLCKIINDSIMSGVFPSRLKHAKVIPIYKNEDVTDPNNYRLTLLLFNLTLIKFWSYKSVPFTPYILHLIGHMPFLLLSPPILFQ